MGEYVPVFSDKPRSLIGTLKAHTWRDTVTLQFHVIDGF